ncbi:16S rRNA methyltransferase [Actinotalea ferrariae CF5-4]|uniref:Ribosomal RNA small subunit methyltransferase E n=1 Tax=Actinotalea ferrariae CF5-4 TaxID=948458 RepID=A0A021VWM2_9CELL|nr:16S rRNA (uracil(1498)-N(3))-methyltransferase [Actinotalea ferrariae]EYR63462.1 16S rRNA methyltransferase [Actinotalea ferrariae CF5-4]
MSAPVFLTGPGLLDALGPGSTYVLEGAEGRHAGVVQRRRAGERVDVADGCGVRVRCEIASVDAGRLVLTVLDRADEPAPRVRLALAQALAKGDRDELAVESATEVGVDEVVPWQARRSVVVWRGERAARSRAKWVATVRQATKQSRRAWVPDVAEPVDTRALVARAHRTMADGGTVVVLHETATLPLAEVALPAPAADGAPAPEVLVVVGPEGGIAEDELEALAEAGASVARLGPHVLRTSTAGPVAVALLAQRLGRWG